MWEVCGVGTRWRIFSALDGFLFENMVENNCDLKVVDNRDAFDGREIWAWHESSFYGET
jgi:hypothetical protein